MLLKKQNILKTAVTMLCMTAGFGLAQAATPTKPNIVTIMIDDMGFSDIGKFGSEIDTPNLDALIDNGTQLTNYYSAPTSTPARAMFFTGRDNHAAGVGNMDGYSPDRPPQTATQATSDEYKGRLTKSLPTFPELLKANGYHTMMTGKWDLGDTPGEYASDRGFVDSLVLLPGGDIHFLSDASGKLITSQPPTYYTGLIDPATGKTGTVSSPYNKNGKQFTAFPANAFSTDFYTDEAIKMLDNRDKAKPFYLNIAHIASHAPFQAPEDLIAKYLPTYQQGWDKLRAQRFAKLKSLGLIPANAVLPPRNIEVIPWDKLTPDKQQIEARRMAAYAGLVDKLDQSVGKLIQHLKDIGQYDNTVFFVMSDNGAAAIESGNPSKQAWVAANFSKDTIDKVLNIGAASSFIPASEGLGMLSNTPLNRYKAETFEGGIHTAAFVFSPKASATVKGKRYDCLTSVMDISATILDMTNTQYPKTFNGNSLMPMDGLSFNSLFKGDLSCKYPNRALGFEQDSAKMLRQGDWKLAQQFDPLSNRWNGHMYLFNLANDPFELHDLSQAYPDQYSKLKRLYAKYAQRNHVIDVGPRLFHPMGNLKLAAPNDTLGGFILGGTQVNYRGVQHLPTLPPVVQPLPPALPINPAKMGDTVDIAAEIYTPNAHKGQEAKIMVAAYYKPVDGSAGQWTAFQRLYKGGFNSKLVTMTASVSQTVDGSLQAPNFSAIPAFVAPIKSLSNRVELPIYEGKLAAGKGGQPNFKPGVYYFWIGYQLKNGAVVNSAKPITLTVASAS